MLRRQNFPSEMEMENESDFGGVARILDHGMWNTGVAMDSYGDDRVFKSLGNDADDESMITGTDKKQAGSGSGEEGSGDDDDADDGYDQIGGSFIAYIAAKYGPPSASRAAQLAMRTIATELDCTRVHAVDTRGFVAHESSGVQSHSVPDACTAMFVGSLENRAELAETCDLPATCTCAELVYKLYTDCGTSFVNQLDGFFAFVLVDAETSTVFAAVDRHGSIPLYKGRSKGGGFA
jgi:hypothetical protein